jgi:hypothetical protein
MVATATSRVAKKHLDKPPPAAYKFNSVACFNGTQSRVSDTIGD